MKSERAYPGQSGSLRLTRYLWFALGLSMVALGIIGALLPVMPTTIFLILALACFGRSSPVLEARLLAHPRYGRALRVWREQGAILVRGKRFATSGIVAGIVLFWLGARLSLVLGVPVSAAMVACAGWRLAAGTAAASRRAFRPGRGLDIGSSSCDRGRCQCRRSSAGGGAAGATVHPGECAAAAGAVIDRPVARSLPELPPAATTSMQTSPVLAESSAAASQAVAPPSPSLPPGAQRATISDPNRESEVLAWLEKFRRYPRQAQVHWQQGVAYVRVRMDRQGQVLSTHVQRGSGHALLDQEALATFLRAPPLPRPPSLLPDPIELEVPVEFSLH